MTHNRWYHTVEHDWWPPTAYYKSPSLQCNHYRSVSSRPSLDGRFLRPLGQRGTHSRRRVGGCSCQSYVPHVDRIDSPDRSDFRYPGVSPRNKWEETAESYPWPRRRPGAGRYEEGDFSSAPYSDRRKLQEGEELHMVHHHFFHHEYEPIMRYRSPGSFLDERRCVGRRNSALDWTDDEWEAWEDTCGRQVSFANHIYGYDEHPSPASTSGSPRSWQPMMPNQQAYDSPENPACYDAAVDDSNELMDDGGLPALRTMNAILRRTPQYRSISSARTNLSGKRAKIRRRLQQRRWNRMNNASPTLNSSVRVREASDPPCEVSTVAPENDAGNLKLAKAEDTPSVLSSLREKPLTLAVRGGPAVSEWLIRSRDQRSEAEILLKRLKEAAADAKTAIEALRSVSTMRSSARSGSQQDTSEAENAGLSASARTLSCADHEVLLKSQKSPYLSPLGSPCSSKADTVQRFLRAAP